VTAGAATVRSAGVVTGFLRTLVEEPASRVPAGPAPRADDPLPPAFELEEPWPAEPATPLRDCELPSRLAEPPPRAEERPPSYPPRPCPAPARPPLERPPAALFERPPPLPEGACAASEPLPRPAPAP
jgi:hypothetical protein